MSQIPFSGQNGTGSGAPSQYQTSDHPPLPPSGYQSSSGPVQTASGRSLSSSRIQNKLSFLREETKRNKEARKALEPLNDSLNETLRGFERITSVSVQQEVVDEKPVKASDLLAVRRSNSKQRQISNLHSQSHQFESQSDQRPVAVPKQSSPQAAIRAKLEAVVKGRGDAEPRKSHIAPQVQEEHYESNNSARNALNKPVAKTVESPKQTKQKIKEQEPLEDEELPVRQPIVQPLKENRNPSKGLLFQTNPLKNIRGSASNAASDSLRLGDDKKDSTKNVHSSMSGLANHLRDLRKASARSRNGVDTSQSSAHNSLSRSFAAPISAPLPRPNNHSFVASTGANLHDDQFTQQSPPSTNRPVPVAKTTSANGAGGLHKSESMKGSQFKGPSLQVPQQLVAKLERFSRQIQKLSSNFDLVASSLQVRPSDETQVFEREMRRYLRDMDKTMKGFLDKTTHY